MPQGAGAVGAAGDATVLTTATDEELTSELVRRGLAPPAGRALLEHYAAESQQAADVIEAKLAGMRQSLETARADAIRLRAAADGSAE